MKVYKAPSKLIGIETGMDFLWNSWGLLDQHRRLEDKLVYGDRGYALKLQNHLWEYILGVEPRFEQYAMHSWWIVMGVTSQFNFEDIVYFCDTPVWERDPAIYAEQEALGWGGNDWIMSPATLNQVKEFKKELAA